MNEGLELQQGFLVADFEHHLTIASPEGRVFQVPKRMSIILEGGGYMVDSDAPIEHVFEGLRQTQGESVLIPKKVLRRLAQKIVEQ